MGVSKLYLHYTWRRGVNFHTHRKTPATAQDLRHAQKLKCRKTGKNATAVTSIGRLNTVIGRVSGRQSLRCL